MTSVMERLICKVCGHDSDEHKFAIPIKCKKCPRQICQSAKENKK